MVALLFFVSFCSAKKTDSFMEREVECAAQFCFSLLIFLKTLKERRPNAWPEAQDSKAVSKID